MAVRLFKGLTARYIYIVRRLRVKTDVLFLEELVAENLNATPD